MVKSLAPSRLNVFKPLHHQTKDTGIEPPRKVEELRKTVQAIEVESEPHCDPQRLDHFRT